MKNYDSFRNRHMATSGRDAKALHDAAVTNIRFARRLVRAAVRDGVRKGGYAALREYLVAVYRERETILHN